MKTSIIASISIAVLATLLLPNIIGSSTSIDDEYAAKGKFPLSIDKPSTGIPHVLAMDITPQPDKEVHEISTISLNSRSDLDWLERSIKNYDKNTRLSQTEKELFFSFVDGGATDVKITDNEGNSEYYRLYFIEVP